MKKNIIKSYIRINLDGWREEINDHFAKHLFKSLAHWNVILLVAENTYFEKDYSFEKICRLISPTVASRATIQRIIVDLLDLNIIEKKIKDSDHRVKFFYLSDEGSELFSQYVENEMITFKSLREFL